jgi:UDP-3-O-[3-hydroxymyristoyl] glucosamine N-acyltransferase
LELKLKELAALVGGQFANEADGEKPIRGAAAIVEAAEGDVTFYGNGKYLPALKKCQATAAFVPEDFTDSAPPVLIRVANPSLAFSRIVEHFAPEPERFAPGVHPTAVIGAEVELGEGVSIQPFVVIEEGARIGARSVVGAHGYIGRSAEIGADCLLHPRVTLGSRCSLGNRVIVQSGAVIGSDGFGFAFTEGKHVKIPQVGVVRVDDDVEIGANVTIDRARFGRTWIQTGTKVDNLVQIAHNVVVGQHCILVAQVGISGSVRLGNYVTLAGQVGVAGHLEIGDQAVVGAQTGINKTLSGKETYMGYPAVPAAEWREQVAHVHRLARLVARVKRLEQALEKQVSGLSEESSPE